MGKRKIILAIIAIGIIALAFSCMKPKAEESVKSPIQIEVGQEFHGIESSQTMYVLNYQIADLNGDSVNDVVIAIGEKESVSDVHAKNIDIVFYDGAMQTYQGANIKKAEGNLPKIDLADVTGDSFLDILLLFEKEEGEKEIRVLCLEQGKLKEIWKAKDNHFIVFTGTFMDGFKVQINNRKLNMKKELDIKDISDSLIENGVFDSSGKYTNNPQTALQTIGFMNVELVQLTGSMGIKTTQRIVSKDRKNIIEEVTIVWKYEDGKWQMKEVTGLKLGNLLY